MKNYEKYHVDKMSIEEIKYIAVTKGGAIMKCDYKNCNMCKFDDIRFCNAAVTKWLLEEYKEPETDWSKVPVDTLVYARYTEEDHFKPRYFAGVNSEGRPCVFQFGSTSKTHGESIPLPAEIKLYEVDE